MSFWRRPELWLIAALAVTIPPKLLLHDTAPSDPWKEASPTVLAFFARHGFAAEAEERPSGVFIHARAGACRLLVRQAVAQGLNLDNLQRTAAEIGRLSFVFAGEIHAEQPVLAASLDYYRTRIRQRIGLATTWRPVMAVAMSPACALESLPWREIAELSS